MNERLYRSRDDRVIAGVAGGIADELDLDPSLVRVAWVVLTIATGGLLAIVYVVMMFVVPEEPDDVRRRSADASPSGETTAAARTPWTPSATSDRPTEAIPTPESRTGAEPGGGGTAAAAAGASGGAGAGSAGAGGAGGPSGAAEPAGTAGGNASTGGRGSTMAGGVGATGGGWQPGAATWREQRRAERDARRDARREARARDRAERHRDSSGAIIFGLLLILLGAWFIARRYLPALEFDQLWPVALVVVGVALVVLSIRPGRRS